MTAPDRPARDLLGALQTSLEAARHPRVEATVPDRPTREQAAHPGSRMVGESYKDHSARAFGMLRAAEVDLAEARAEVRALRAEGERKVSIDVRMERPPAPDWGGEMDDDGVQLYHHAWDSTDETLRLWVGPYAVGDSGPWWAVTVGAPGIDVVMRCTPDEVVEWADMMKEAVTDGPALVARTPQPVENTVVHAEACRIIREAWGALPESVAHLARAEGATLAGCIRAIPAPLPAVPDGPHLDELHRHERAAIAAVLARCDEEEDNRPSCSCAGPPDFGDGVCGSHESDCASLEMPMLHVGEVRDLLTGVPPQPAAPNAEDVAVRRRWAAWLVESAAQADDLTEREAQGMRIAATHLLDDEIAARAARIDGLDEDWLSAFTERLHDRIEAHRFAVRTVRAAAASGEDVPARLDAAAEALDKVNRGGGPSLRNVAIMLRKVHPDVRAAVAAALARPTERER